MSTTTPQTTDKFTIEKTFGESIRRVRRSSSGPDVLGPMKVKGRFEGYDGALDLRQDPEIELTIDAASLDTKNKMRTSTCARAIWSAWKATQKSASSPGRQAGRGAVDAERSPLSGGVEPAT
jgi:polyisoprenoid-binding protein YceI